MPTFEERIANDIESYQTTTFFRFDPGNISLSGYNGSRDMTSNSAACEVLRKIPTLEKENKCTKNEFEKLLEELNNAGDDLMKLAVYIKFYKILPSQTILADILRRTLMDINNEALDGVNISNQDLNAALSEVFGGRKILMEQLGHSAATTFEMALTLMLVGLVIYNKNSLKNDWLELIGLFILIAASFLLTKKISDNYSYLTRYAGSLFNHVARGLGNGLGRHGVAPRVEVHEGAVRGEAHVHPNAVRADASMQCILL